MRMYNTTASIKIPLEIEYKCCYCDNETVDTEQQLSIAASSHGSMSPGPGLAQEARRRLAESLSSALEDLQEGNYKPAYLKCKCPACGKRQPWASFKRQNTVTFTLLGLSLLFLISFIIGMDSMTFPIMAGVVFLALLVAPWAGIEIYNLVMGQRVSKLDGQYRPRIILQRPEEKANKL